MPGKDTDYVQWHEKQMELESKLSDKAVASMLDTQAVDDDLGMVVPGLPSSGVKDEASEDLDKLKTLIKDLGKT